MEHYRGTGALLYVTDAPNTDATHRLADALSAPLVCLNSLPKDRLTANPNVVFDLDLSKVETVRQLKTLLAGPVRGCRVFLVESGRRVTSVHAQVLGADAILPRPATARQIRAAIAMHQKFLPTEGANAIARQTIDEGMRVLDQGFQTLLDDVDFDSAQSNAASGRIADTISALGAKQWLDAVKSYHAGTFQHCMLVTGVVASFALGLGMQRPDVVKLTLAGMLHDIGKAAIPIDILDKPGALTESETAILRRHPIIGHEYLRARSNIADDILRSVRHHHEMLDGTGYPDRLGGWEIGDITRIVTICDIYAALIERRSYKAPKSPQEALEILKNMVAAGKLEDSLVREFGRIMVPTRPAEC